MSCCIVTCSCGCWNFILLVWCAILFGWGAVDRHCGYVVVITVCEAWGVIHDSIFVVWIIVIRTLDICERHPLPTSGFQHGFGHWLMGWFAEFGRRLGGC